MDLRKLWCEELRSGRYQQTHDFLKLGNGYCCLGVLCDIAYKQAVYHIPLENYKNLETERIPDEIMKAAKISYDQCRELSVANDDGKTFDYIANMIEELPEVTIAEV